MTRPCICVIIASLLAGPAPGLAGVERDMPKVFTEQDSGKTLTLKVGERFTLNLRNPASGGYSVLTPVYDRAIITLVSQEKLPPEKTQPPRAGDFGRLVLVFEALAPGNTTLTINIARPWEKDQPPLPFLRVEVKVKK